MSAERIADRRMIVRGLVTVLACTCCLLASLAVGQEPEPSRRKAVPAPAAGPKEAKQDQELHVQIYRLKNADAARVAEIVIEVYRDRPIKLTADKNANSIVVAAPAQMQAQISALIAQLDSKAERGADRYDYRIFKLVNAEARDAAKVIATLLGPDQKVAVDARTNSVLVQAPQDTLLMIDAILTRLDETTDKDAQKGAPGATLRVRVVWLASQLPADEGAKPADDLKEVVGELSKVGVDGLRQLGQAIVNTTPDGKFQVNCSPLLAGRPADLEISGTMKLRQETPILDVQLSASQTEPAPVVARQFEGGRSGQPGTPAPVERVMMGRRSTKRLVDLGTTIAAPLGHYVVLGVTPVEKMTSVFIVQVTAGKQ